MENILSHKWIALFLYLKKYIKRLPFYGMTSQRKFDVLNNIYVFHNKTILWQKLYLLRKILLFSSFIVWPFRALYLSIYFTKMQGLKIRKIYSKTIFCQFTEQMKLAFFKNIPPKYYYYFGFYKNPTEIDCYFTDNHIVSIFSYLNRHLDSNVLSDKYRFALLCDKHDIATAPIIADINDGEIMWGESFYSLPQCDLIFKRRIGARGEGLHRWIYFGDNRYKQTNHTRILSADDLIRQYLIYSKQNRYLIQPRLCNHPEIDDLSNGSLITIRMLTAITQDNSIQEISSMFNMPAGKGIVNNLIDGALSSHIDKESGVLSKAFCRSIDCQRHQQHFDTGAKIPGKKIPFWQETVALAIKAHKAVGEFAVVGWDIAITEKEPVILEGNSNPSLNFHQLAPGLPFGKTEFADILAWHIAKV